MVDTKLLVNYEGWRDYMLSEVLVEEFEDLEKFAEYMEDSFTLYIEENKFQWDTYVTLEQAYEELCASRPVINSFRERICKIQAELDALASDANKVGLQIKDFASTDIIDTCGWRSSSIGC